MPTVVAVAVLGGVGAVARYSIERAFARSGTEFPWSTVLINVTGSFLVGVLFALVIERTLGPSWMRVGLALGLLGGFTTFSAFSLQSFRLIEDGAYGAAIANMVGSLALGLVAVTVGVVIGRAF